MPFGNLYSELFSDLENSKFSLRKSWIFLEKRSKICLSPSGYKLESWNYAWTCCARLSRNMHTQIWNSLELMTLHYLYINPWLHRLHQYNDSASSVAIFQSPFNEFCTTMFAKSRKHLKGMLGDACYLQLYIILPFFFLHDTMSELERPILTQNGTCN
jgi:hypothetical protein